MVILRAERPIAPQERILALDVLRGFAMFGVLLAYAMWSLGTAPEENWTSLDVGLAQFAGFAVDGKFYTILAFLFGLGFSIQLSRASDDASAIDIYCRRLAVLAAIGLAHALLLRNGDILLPYALTGFLLIPFRRAADRTLLVAALVALLVTCAAPIFWSVTGIPSPARPQLENAPYLVENAAWVRYWYVTAIFNWPLNFTLFLFGLLAGRHQAITRLAANRQKLLAITAVGLAMGAGLYFTWQQLLVNAATPTGQSLGLLTFTLHCWAMSSAYAALLLLALRTRAGVSILAAFAAVGRLALTNYLMQAALIVPVCLAFGLFNRFTPTLSLLLTLFMFVLIQVPFSLLWLRKFQYGPAEWLWRMLSYGRVTSLSVIPPGSRLDAASQIGAESSSAKE